MDLIIIVSLAGLAVTVIGAGIAIGRSVGTLQVNVIDRIEKLRVEQDGAIRRVHQRVDMVDAKINANTTHIATIRKICDERHNRRSPPTESFIAHA